MEPNKEISGLLHLIENGRHRHSIHYKFKSLTQQEDLLNQLMSEANPESDAYIIQCDADNQYIATHNME